MESVASHLVVAANNKIDDDFDQFVRSAINRYYYATYLEMRTMIGSIKPEWSSTPHASYPDFLNGSFKRHLEKLAKEHKKFGDHSKASLLRTVAKRLEDMAGLMDVAFKARVVADYEPEVRVTRSPDGNHSLKSTTIEEAKSWVSRASGIKVKVLKAYG